MNAHSTYEALRHLADSWGLVVMTGIFLGLALWPFRPGAKALNREVANSIFKDESDV